MNERPSFEEMCTELDELAAVPTEVLAAWVTDRGRCLTHDLWEELGNQIHLYLSSVTVADVCERRILGSSHVMLTDAVREPRAAAAAEAAE